MEIRLLNDQELSEVYERHMRRAFPSSELRPLAAMREMVRQGIYRTYGLVEGEQILGEAFLWDCAPGWKLLDYLCIVPERRGGGLGAALIGELADAERGSVIFGESEIPTYAPDPQMAERRLDFYQRCGARKASYLTSIFGVEYHTLYWWPGELDERELMAVHQRAYRDRLSEKLFERFVRIPWDCAMGVPEQHPWEE